jgi:MFS family permease
MNKAGCQIAVIKAKLREVKGSDDKRKRLYHTICTFNPLSLCFWLHFPFPFFTPTTNSFYHDHAGESSQPPKSPIRCTPETPVGFVQGGSQALSRSLFSRLVPIHKNAEFFGFYGLCGKFSAIFGPAVFGLVGQLTGSSRNGIASLALFFVIGIVLLLVVDLEKGKREALAGEDSSDQGMKMA